MSQNKVEIVVDPAEPTITARRVVSAPRSLVWDCYFKPEHVRRWKAPKGVDVVAMEIDARLGGAWRVVYRQPDGAEFGFHGEYREYAAPERFVRTFIMNGTTDETLETVVLAESGAGKTLITTTYEYKTMAVRDAMMQRGTSWGIENGFAALDELLASFAASSGAPRSSA